MRPGYARAVRLLVLCACAVAPLPARAAETGMLYVKSKPKGAMVFVDGMECGSTPVLVKDLKAGERQVEIRLPGVPAHVEGVTIEAGKVARLDVKFELPKASLTVVTEPFEAAVRLDRRERGLSPLTIEDIEPGEHELILMKEGFEQLVRKVDLAPGEKRVVEVRLEREGARGAAKVLDEFFGLVERGDYGGARSRLEAASRDPALEARGALLGDAAGVLHALEARGRAIRKGAEALVGKEVEFETKSGKRSGKVKDVTEEGVSLAAEIRIRGRLMGETRFTVKWETLAYEQVERLARGWAKDAHGKVARAVLALGRKDHAAAVAALEGAGDDPLAARLRARAEALRLRPQETTHETRPEKDTTPARGLVGWWRLDEARGQIVRDHSGNGNDGTLGPTAQVEPADPRWVRGRLGNALQFDGVNDYVRIPRNADFDFVNTDFSVALWVKAQAWRNPIGGAATLVDCETGGWNGWLVRYSEHLSRVAFGGKPAERRVLNTVPAVGSWAHVAITYSEGTATLKGYLNGVLDRIVSENLNLTASTTDHAIGNNAERLQQGLDGLLDDVRIYNRALSAEEIRALAARK